MTLDRARRSVLLLPLAALAAAIVTGCPKGPAPSDGEHYNIPSDLEPAALTYTKDKLTVNRNMAVQVAVKYNRAGNDINVDLVADGDVFEQETYRLDGNDFLLVNVALTKFDPPLPLLRFPFTVGDEPWTWKGKIVWADNSSDATAKVTTSAVKAMLLPDGSDDAVRVDVSLTFELGGSQATRRMSFWFVKKKGLVRREIEDTSEREPVEAGG